MNAKIGDKRRVDTQEELKELAFDWGLFSSVVYPGDLGWQRIESLFVNSNGNHRCRETEKPLAFIYQVVDGEFIYLGDTLQLEFYTNVKGENKGTAYVV